MSEQLEVVDCPDPSVHGSPLSQLNGLITCSPSCNPSWIMTCAKKGYRDKFSAQLALFSTRIAKTERGERRIYWHKECGKWHLTSKVWNPRKVSK